MHRGSITRMDHHVTAPWQSQRRRSQIVDFPPLPNGREPPPARSGKPCPLEQGGCHFYRLLLVNYISTEQVGRKSDNDDCDGECERQERLSGKSLRMFSAKPTFSGENPYAVQYCCHR